MGATVIDLPSLRCAFHTQYGDEPRFFWAPGRVNLIGEHTDYNDGFVLPVAIDLGTVVAGAPRNDRRLRIHSLNVKQAIDLDLDAPAGSRRGDWTDYVEGVARTLEVRGWRLTGANLALESNVPLGGGLSSSAALEMSVGLALLTLSGHDADPMELAHAGQDAEKDFAGTNCGIMDQCVAMLAREGHALLIDCRSLKATSVPVDDSNIALVVCDSGVRHSLATSEYNVRRAECERGTELLRALHPGIRSLRDIDEEALRDCQNRLPEPIGRRCRHVVSENARTEAAAEALRAGDLDLMGELMSISHRSLRDDYEVSCVELDLLVSIAEAVDGVLGARMTGGGFGGCTINLVRRDSVAEFQQRVWAEYNRATGRTPVTYIVKASSGAAEINAHIPDPGEQPCA
jgi:galactokinase